MRPELLSYPNRPPNTHTPAVSFSANNQFDQCSRQWAYAKLTHYLPPQIKHEAFLHKVLMSSSAFAGQLFHDTVDDALREYTSTGKWPNNLVSIASRLYKGYVDFTKRWISCIENGPGQIYEDPYRPLAEFYWNGMLDQRVKDAVASDVKRWLGYFNAFFERELAPLPLETLYLPPRDNGCSLPWFWSGHRQEVPVYAVYDLAIRTPSKTTIYDWKSGKRSEYKDDAAIEQLIGYAAFAASEWKVDVNDIEIVVYWLQENAPVRREVTKSEIDGMIRRWSNRYKTYMDLKQQLMAAPDQFTSLFPTTDDLQTCRFCPFRTCDGYQKATGVNTQVAIEPIYDVD